MHMQSLGEGVKSVLRSLPIKVEFAGFESNTLKLAKAGWDLSMQQEVDPRYGDYRMRLAMRFGDRNNAMYAISNSISMDWEHKRAHVDPNYFVQLVESLGFSIQVMRPEISFRHIMAERGTGLSFAQSFMPIDAVPQREEESSIRDFKFFKIANPSVKDLIVDPSDVPELLDAVLKAQRPLLEKIKKRERSRDNELWVREGMPVKPMHTVQAQIISLAG